MTLDADEAWFIMLNEVRENGSKASPRGKPTLELLGHQVKIDMIHPVLTVGERRLGYRFMAAEAAWILSGDDRVATIAPYSKEMMSFSDNGTTLFGAYGPQLRRQLDYVCKMLERDAGTRQAAANIWRENPPRTRDVPCTLSTHFLVRHGYLHQFVTMRSSDVWLGMPYDLFSFSMWGAYVLLESGLAAQGVNLGVLINTASSRHLYESNFNNAAMCLNSQRLVSYKPFNLAEFHTGQELIDHLWACARGEQRQAKFLEEFCR